MNSVLVANHWVICFLWRGSDIQDPRSPMSYSCPFPKVRKWLSGEVLGNLTHLGSHWIVCWLHSNPLKLVCSFPEYKVVWKHSMWCSELHGRIVVFSFIDLIVCSYFLWDGHFIYDVSHDSVKLISLSLLSFFVFLNLISLWSSWAFLSHQLISHATVTMMHATWERCMASLLPTPGASQSEVAKSLSLSLCLWYWHLGLVYVSVIGYYMTTCESGICCGLVLYYNH